jgi:hypothetical protein
VIGSRCHHIATEKKPDNRPPERRSAPRAKAEIKGLIIAGAYRLSPNNAAPTTEDSLASVATEKSIDAVDDEDQ